ncbi:MAG: hypothetical protein J5725_00455 [Bacteroidales bacterium]|nr:hypothetical protein [Bacteroidales bacterium]
MNKQESEELIKEIENHAVRRMAKGVYSSYAEGKNYGIMLMFEIAKEIIERRTDDEKI